MTIIPLSSTPISHISNIKSLSLSLSLTCTINFCCFLYSEYSENIKSPHYYYIEGSKSSMKNNALYIYDIIALYSTIYIHLQCERYFFWSRVTIQQYILLLKLENAQLNAANIGTRYYIVLNPLSNDNSFFNHILLHFVKS